LAPTGAARSSPTAQRLATTATAPVSVRTVIAALVVTLAAVAVAWMVLR
jgi:hypothetical protein